MTKVLKPFWILSMILAPLLTAIAQFFWHNGIVSATSGVLQVYSYFFWIFAFQGMFHILEDKIPKYASIGFIIAVLACIGGNNFGVDGIYSSFANITDVSAKNNMHAQIGPITIFYLFVPGLLFPLSLLGLAIAMVRTKTVPTWIGLLLAVAAIGFPMSRIPRMDWLAHVDNLLLVVSHLFIIPYIQRKAK